MRQISFSPGMDVRRKHIILSPFGCCAVFIFLLTGCRSSETSTQKFLHFEESSYLQSLWADTCAFPLTEENIVMIASVQNETGSPVLRCDWGQTPVGVGDSGVTLAGDITDLDYRWFACGKDTSLPGLVWDAVRYPGSNLVHLGGGLPSGAQEAIVLAAKCHYWDSYYCTIKAGNPNCDSPDADRILSMAYAVFDPATESILW